MLQRKASDTDPVQNYLAPSPSIQIMIGLLPYLLAFQPAYTVVDVVFPEIGGGMLQGRMFAPQPLPKGPTPLVGILPGGAAPISSVEWAASSLASNGYLAITVLPSRGGSVQAYATALESALTFASSSQNPYLTVTDLNRMGGAGWSLGARALTLVQHRDSRLKAIVAWDNLAAVETGDQGSPSANFNPPQSSFRTPKVPALGIASDATSFNTDPEVKKTAYNWWLANKKPAMQIVFANSNHFWWGASGNERQRNLSMHYTKNWFDLWLNQDQSARKRLLTEFINGENRRDFLSTKFHSAAYIDARPIADLRRLTGSITSEPD